MTPAPTVYLPPQQRWQRPTLNFPNEVYLDIFQHKVYHIPPTLSKYSRIFALHLTSRGLIPESSTDQNCTFSHRACGCSLRCAVRLLRVCQMVYIETQPYLLLNATLVFQPDTPPGRLYIADYQYHMGPSQQLKLFRQRFLNSSLSGRVPITFLRRLYLQFDFRSSSDPVDILRLVTACAIAT